MAWPETSIVVQVKHGFAAGPETVFDAWLDPRIASKFFFATETGTMVCCDINAKPGGAFTVIDRRPKDDGGPGTHDVVHVGQYLALERPHRLAFSFTVPEYSKEETTVTLDITPGTSGGSELTLTHDLGTRDTARQYRDKTENGWKTVLGNLDRALG
jgi:uncharacterized protein YndB with AHSA1/START domain